MCFPSTGNKMLNEETRTSVASEEVLGVKGTVAVLRVAVWRVALLGNQDIRLQEPLCVVVAQSHV